MGENKNIKQFAYFREYTHNQQYELHFIVETKIPNLGEIKEEIKAVRSVADTVSNLLQHIKNKVFKILKDKFVDNEVGKEILNDNFEIQVSLKNGKRELKPTLHLTAFKNNLLNGHFIIFQIFDQQYIVHPNAPYIKQFKLPPVIYAETIVQPIKFTALYTDQKKSSFIWYKSKDKEKWSEVGQGFGYLTKTEDLDFYLKLVCKPINNFGINGPSGEAISNTVVEKMGQLPVCPFERRHEYTKQKLTSKFEFRVVTYNLLAEKYANLDENHGYCQPRFLAIDYRKQLIAKELLGYKADIICLQEVDNRHYVNFFKELFKENGYYSFYHRKGNRIPEGLTFIYNRAKFKHVEEKQIVFNNEIQNCKTYQHLWEILKQNETVKNDFLKQSTSLQVTVLKVLETNKYLIVANTHLYYHPEANHIRLLQVTMASQCLSNYRRKYQKYNTDVSVIFCGDFNSSCESSLFPFMLQGSILPSDPDCLRINPNGRAILFHEFNFESACGTPQYTNYTPDYKGCLDYIFIERHKMLVKQMVPLTDEEELAKYEGLPNEVFPSDHLALVVDLKFRF